MTKEVDYENFSKVVDLTVKRVKLKNVESTKFCKTESIKRHQEKKMIDTHFKT